MKRVLKMAFACALAFGVIAPIATQPTVVYAAETKDIDALIQGSFATLEKNNSRDALIGISYLATNLDEAGIQHVETTYLPHAIEFATSARASATDIEKAIMLIEGLGYDATAYTQGNETINFISLLEAKNLQQVNELAYALEALHSANYIPDADSALNPDVLIKQLISMSNPKDGGYNWNGSYTDATWGVSEVDMTAMVLSALAPYVTNSAVSMGISTETKTALEQSVARSFTYLSTNQADSGAMLYYGNENSSSTALTLLALTAYGKDSNTDASFNKKGHTLLQGLLTFAADDNSGFGVTDNTSVDAYFATPQCLYALIAYKNAEVGTPYYLYQAGAIKNENRWKENNDKEDNNDAMLPSEPQEEPIVKDTSMQLPTDATYAFTISLMAIAVSGYFIKRKKA